MSTSSSVSTGGGGRIIAQNPALLDMLRERTLELQRKREQTESVEQEQSGSSEGGRYEEPPLSVSIQAEPETHESVQDQEKPHTSTENTQVRRFYVDSPAFTREDEEKYKFVDPDIDNASSESFSSRGVQKEPDSVDVMPTVAQLAKATSELIESNTRAQTQISNGDHGVNPDTNMSHIKSTTLPYTAHDCSQHQARFYNKVDPSEKKSDPFEKLNKIAAKRSEMGEEYQTRVIEPIHSPLKTIPDEQLEELRLLEEEQQYQQQLQLRIHSTKEASDRFSIPKLDLDEVVSDDDDEKRAKKSQAVRDSLETHRNLADYEAHQLRDSLEPSQLHDPAYAYDDFRDSLEVDRHHPNAPDTYQLQVKYKELEQRLSQLEAEKQTGFTLRQSQGDQRMQQLFDSNRSDAKRMTSSDLKNLQNPGVQQQFFQEYQYIEEEEEYGPDPPVVSQVPPPRSTKPSGSYKGAMPINFGAREEPVENGYVPDASANQPPVAPYDPTYQEHQMKLQREMQASGQEPAQRGQYRDSHQKVPLQYVQQPMPNQQALPYANDMAAQQQYANQPYANEQYEDMVPSQGYEGQQFADEQHANQPYANEPYANEQYANDPPPFDARYDQFGQSGAPEQRTPLQKGYRSAPDLSNTQTVDYIELNKRVLREEVKSAATYGKLYQKKKEDQKENVSPVPARRKLKGKQGAGSRATSQGSTAARALPPTAEDGSGDTEQQSASEQLWAQRAKNLAHEKDRKLSSQQQKAKKGSYRKDGVPSRGVSSQPPPGPNSRQVGQDGPPPQQQYAQPAYQPPGRHGQPAHQPPPAPAQWHAAPNQQPPPPPPPVAGSPAQPIKHTVYTDDGQRVSVDINLKMVQPDTNVGPYSHVQGDRHAQQQPAYTVGALTQQNIAAQYGQKAAPVNHHDNMHIQSITSSASSAGVGDPNHLRRQYRQAVNAGPQQYPLPAQPQMQGQPQQFNQYAPPANQYGPPANQYGLPRQPEGSAQVPPQFAAQQQTLPSQDPRFMMQHPVARPVQPSKHGFTKHGKAPPAQPMQAFEQYQPTSQETDPYYEQYDIPESTQNISGMSSPTSYRGAASPSMSPYKIVPPIGSAEREGRGKPGVFTNYRKTSPGKDTAETTPYNPVSGDGGGSYMDQLKNKKREVHYKQYTLKDYRNLKREIKLGGLGPNLDSDTTKEKRDKLQRQLNYARSINDRNRQDYEYAARKPKSRPESDQQSEEDLMDRRKLALEYAKSVPKPKVKPQREEDEEVVADLRQPRYKYVQGRHTNSMRTITTMRDDGHGNYVPDPRYNGPGNYVPDPRYNGPGNYAPDPRQTPPQNWHVQASHIGTNTNTGKTTTTLRDAYPSHESSRHTSKYATREPSRSEHDHRGAGGVGGGGIDLDLQALQERHQADKEKAALIRQNIQGSVAS